jgi:hypothetical protein
MNKFTKEELESIADWGYLYCLDSEISARVHANLRDKIQSLIDNYCEHDGEIGKDYPAEKCMKCGAYWE